MSNNQATISIPRQPKMIAEILNKGVSSGEIIITDKNYNDLGSILIR